MSDDKFAWEDGDVEIEDGEPEFIPKEAAAQDTGTVLPPKPKEHVR